MLQLVRIEEALPDDFPALADEARTEGFGHMDRLSEEFAARREMFTALIAAYCDGRLLGVGGLTPEPEAHPGEAWRMRRLYVRPEARRRGVGGAIVNALLAEGLNLTRLITVHAGARDSARFWEALGWTPVQARAWSHQFRTA
ncbi:MAG: GNAT family N-acetyltransferase [Proteobacteria bacterium]|nr:GNAT family N-acetyltransferase [Pseudomonadota bacterium]